MELLHLLINLHKLNYVDNLWHYSELLDQFADKADKTSKIRFRIKITVAILLLWCAVSRFRRVVASKFLQILVQGLFQYRDSDIFCDK